MKRTRKASWVTILLVAGIVLLGTVPAWAVPDKETAITGAADRLVPLQSAVDAGWDWIITGATSHSGNPSAYNMYGVVILGLLDAYGGTADTSYYDAATSMANRMTNNLAGDAGSGEFHKNGVSKETAGAYDYQFLMRYGGVSGNSGYSDYAIELWYWNKGHTAAFATPEALNDALLGWAGSDPGAASWMLAAYGEASRLVGDTAFATGCANLIEADLSGNGLGWLIGDYMAEAECLEFLSRLAPATYASTINRVIADLVDNQQGNGCWNDGYASTLQDTAYAVRALGVYSGAEGDNAARNGASWLAANQLANGGWLDGANEYSEQNSEGLRGLYFVTAPVTNNNDGKSYYIIQDAIDEAVAFDTIYVAPGTYYENVNLNEVVALWTNPGAVIDGGAVGNAVNVNADGVTIDGFEIRNGYNGIEGGDRSFLLIIDNEIHDNLNIPGSAGVGILLWGDNDNNDIIGNEIYNNDRQGIFIGYGDPSKISSGNWIEGNIIYNNGLYTNPNGPDASAYGIQFWVADENYIVENEIYDHDDWFPYGGTFDFAQGIYLCDAYGNLIMGNDLHDNNYGVGQYLSQDNKVHVNSIAGNTGYGVMNHDADPSQVIDAALNWWGDAEGPTHATNPLGTGDSVSDNVIYSPWLGIGTDTQPGTVGWQPVSPMLIIVAPVGPKPPAETVLGQVVNTVPGYLNRAIGAANLLPGADTIEVRPGTYNAGEAITDTVTMESTQQYGAELDGHLEVRDGADNTTLQGFLIYPASWAIGVEDAGNVTTTGNKIVGEGPGGADDGILYGPGPAGAAPGTITNNTIEDIDFGIMVDWNNHAGQYVISGNTVDTARKGIGTGSLSGAQILNNIIANCTQMGIEVFKGDINEAHYNSIVGNTTGAWNAPGSADFDATLNWWGNREGPTHAENPAGTGDAVVGNVIYSPWLGIDADGDPITPGVQLVSPMLIIVDDVGPEPAAGHLNTAIAAANSADLPGTDTIEVRHGTYNATELITQPVNIISEAGSASHTFLDGNMTLRSGGILIGEPLQGFRVNGNLTVEALVNAASCRINWCDVYGNMTNNGTGTFDAQYNFWGTQERVVVDGRTTGAIDFDPFLPKNADGSYNDIQAMLNAGLVPGLNAAIDHLWTMTNLGLDVGTYIQFQPLMGAGALAGMGGPGTSMGAGAGGTILNNEIMGRGGAVEGVDLAASYTPGETIEGGFVLTDPLTGALITDATVTLSIVHIAPDGSTELIHWGMITYDEGTGEYVFNFDTSGMAPGNYDLLIQTDDGQSFQLRIEIAEP